MGEVTKTLKDSMNFFMFLVCLSTLVEGLYAFSRNLFMLIPGDALALVFLSCWGAFMWSVGPEVFTEVG